MTVTSRASASTTNAPFEFEVWGGTDPGKRYGHNEDSISPEGAGAPLPDGSYLLVVADGVGGSQLGEVASRMAITEVVNYCQQRGVGPDPAQTLQLAIQSANTVVYNYVAASSVGDSASTVVAALIKERQLHVANVGDSRAYLIRGGKILQFSKDHTLTQQKIDAGLLAAADARFDDQRNIITRSLGGGPTVQVDVNLQPVQRLRPGDRVLLCSDGLTDVLEDDELERLTRRKAPPKAVKTLIKKANQRGGPDNISVIFGRVPAPNESSAIPWPYLLLGFAGMLLLLACALLGVGLFSSADSGESTATLAAAASPDLPGDSPAAPAAATPTPAATAPAQSAVTDTLPAATVTAPPAIVTSTPFPTYTPATAAAIPTLDIDQTPVIPVEAPPANPAPAEESSPTAPVGPPSEFTSPRLANPENDLVARPGIGTTFEWYGMPSLPENHTYEIRIWQGDESHDGAFDAKETKKYLMVKNPAQNLYSLSIDVSGAYSVQLHGDGDYLWSVAVVQIEPYQRIGAEAEPRRIKYSSTTDGRRDDKDNEGDHRGDDTQTRPD